MFYSAADDFNIDLGRSIFIGDSDTDVQAAQAAGCRPILVGSGLQASSGSPGWAVGLPTALTAEDLFGIAVERLQTSDHAVSDDHAARPSGH